MSRQQGRRVAAGVASAAGVLAGSVVAPDGAGALARGHGSWTAHTYVLTDPSPSSYSLYGRISASQRHDFAHVVVVLLNAQNQTIVRQHTVTCAGNESCLSTRTTTTSFSQGYYNKRIHFMGCAHDGWVDGGHGLGGGSVEPGPKPCQIQQRPPNFGWLGAHEHWSVVFS